MSDSPGKPSELRVTVNGAEHEWPESGLRIDIWPDPGQPAPPIDILIHNEEGPLRIRATPSMPFAIRALATVKGKFPYIMIEGDPAIELSELPDCGRISKPEHP